MSLENYQKKCVQCPRNCGAERAGKKLGYCQSNEAFNIASICIHKGEEPVVSGKTGICNVFFTHCNLQCIYCQNAQISQNLEDFPTEVMLLDEVLQKIIVCLDAGCKAVGFVSPSHCITQMKSIISALHLKGYKPIIVYNSNGYDKVETLREIEELIDVYLPDFKYMDSKIAGEYSDAPDYPEVATTAIREMFRQKGSTLRIDDDGQIESGLIIRHLILPDNLKNSLAVLNYIADHFSVSVAVSLMSQYYPIAAVKSHPVLNRKITVEEYNEVVNEMEKLGFYKGWIQELDSSENYQPDFNNKHPFEKQ